MRGSVVVMIGLFGLACGGVGGWFTASFIVRLGQLDIGYTFLGVLLAGITIIPAIQIASLPPITIMWLRLWCPALGFALSATAATTYSLAIQAHRAAWVAAVLALVVAALVLLQIIIACRKKAKEITESFNERLRDVLRYDHY
jgi:hypothetical protein